MGPNSRADIDHVHERQPLASPSSSSSPKNHSQTEVSAAIDDYGAMHDYSSKSQEESTGSAAPRISNLREQFWKMRGLSSEHLTSSFRRIKKAIDEHTGSIGMLGSLSIAINNLTGPSMLALPATFARSGIIPTTLTLILACLLSALCSLHMANVISKVPGNEDFKRGIEFPEAFQTFWGHRWFVLANWLFFACITCLNVSSLVDNAQVVDQFLGQFNPWGGSYALAIDPYNWNATITTWDKSFCDKAERYAGGCIPFAAAKEDDEDVLILTVGYVFTAVLFFPLALMDLTENVAWQILGFIILLVTSVQFIVTFSLTELDTSSLSWWGDSYDSLLGVVLFNFALVITVPAWLYEKDPDVDIPTVLHGSAITSTVLYIAIGILGCLAMPDVSDNMLESIMSGALGPAMQIGASIFAFFIIGLNIPLFSVLTRLSLTGGGNELRSSVDQSHQLLPRPIANILAVYLPFGLSWTLYQGSKVTQLLSWGGIIFTSLVAFLLPLALSLDVVRKFDDMKGTVEVYAGRFAKMIDTKESEVLALWILLALSTMAVVIAIAGNVIAVYRGDSLD